MPTTWTQKDEKQYKKIRESALERGKSSSEAKELAARTVNKQRRKEGRTPRETTQGTGNPNTRLEDRTLDELYNLAKEQNIQGRSKLNKAGLIEAIRDKR